MNYKMLELELKDMPETVRHIPSPPQKLFYKGDLFKLLKQPGIAIVGTRRMTAYGRQVTEQFARNLAERGIVVISGLAYGVDITAHRAALGAGGPCIAVLPGPLDNVVPVAHRQAAEQILEQGGALVSEYPPGTIPRKQFFIARNRLMSGLADAVLITEAIEKSGALYTAEFAVEQGRDILAVPGNIYSPASAGTNNLIKTMRAATAASYMDVLDCLGIERHDNPALRVRGRNAHEQKILDLMREGSTDGTELLEASGLEVREFNKALTMLEIGGKIRALGANHWTVVG